MRGTGQAEPSIGGVIGMDVPAHSHHRGRRQRPERLKWDLINRLHLAQGQIQALRRMVEDGRSCGDALLQVTSARESLSKVGHLILQDYLCNCVLQAVQQGDVAVYEEMRGVLRAVQR